MISQTELENLARKCSFALTVGVLFNAVNKVPPEIEENRATILSCWQAMSQADRLWCSQMINQARREDKTITDEGLAIGCQFAIEWKSKLS